MTTVIIFSVIGGVLLLSIIFSSIAYKRQQALALKKSRVNQLSRSIYDLEETLNTLLHTDPAYDLILIMHQQLISVTEKKLALEPRNRKTQHQLELQKTTHTKFRNNEREHDVSKAMQSDEAINLANFHLQQVSKLLHKFTLSKKLSPAKFSELSNYILRLSLDIEVESHIAQADRYSASNDVVLTQSHLKQARESLRAFSGDFPEKAELIRSLTRRIKEINQTNSVIADEQTFEPEDTILQTDHITTQPSDTPYLGGNTHQAENPQQPNNTQQEQPNKHS